jgi:RiboL-PSP-HEPN
MARFTAAYANLIAGINETESTRRLADELQLRDPLRHTKEIDALCRASVVLLCSHIEGYVKGLGELLIDRMHSSGMDRRKLPRQFFHYVSQDYIRQIKETDDRAKIAGHIFNFIDRDGSIWAETGSLPCTIDTEIFNTGFSTPKYDKICKYFTRFGLTTYSQELGRMQAADHRRICNAIDHVVDTRNKIAHGDIGVTKTPVELAEMISCVRDFCRNTDSVVGRLCRQQLCSIR